MSEKSIDRRRFMYATGIAGATFLAGCSEGGTDGGDGGDGASGDGGDDGESGGGDTGGDGGDGGGRTYLDDEPGYDGWLDSASNFEGTVDWTGQDEVTVLVGYDSLAFDPAAVAISPGTTVTWEWTGEGGGHDVVRELERSKT